jgi:hypothetical protein
VAKVKQGGPSGHPSQKPGVTASDVNVHESIWPRADGRRTVEDPKLPTSARQGGYASNDPRTPAQVQAKVTHSIKGSKLAAPKHPSTAGHARKISHGKSRKTVKASDPGWSRHAHR